jgi:6-phosphogluconate dehydrogenase
MKIAIIGLGKMGYQFVEKLVAAGIEVIASDRDQTLMSAAQDIGAMPASSREDIVSIFAAEDPIVWLMIPAGAVEDEVLAWQPLLTRNSILIDGGNSNFNLSKKRADLLSPQGVSFLDVGTSGGILGATNGFSMMVGGSEDAYKTITPILDALSRPSGTHNYFGPSGSGHYVKMVHNAIEYGLMESLAEGYHMLKEGPYKEINLSNVAEVWQHGSIVESLLNGLAEQVLIENPNLDGINGVVAESGEAAWTLEVAKQLGIAMPVTQAAFDVRVNSQKGQISYATKLLAALRNKFGGHAINPQ